jgi:hypothetical protein
METTLIETTTPLLMLLKLNDTTEIMTDPTRRNVSRTCVETENCIYLNTRIFQIEGHSVIRHCCS